MKPRKKSGGRDWKPGQSGNPNGRPSLPDDVRSAISLNKVEFVRIADGLMSLTEEQLLAKIEDRKTSALELMVAKVITRAIWKGDHKRLDFLLTRTIGRVPQPKEEESTAPTSFIDLVKRAEVAKKKRGE